MEPPGSSSYVLCRTRARSPESTRIERIIAQCDQESAVVEQQLSAKAGFINGCLQALEQAANEEVVAIDAQIGAIYTQMATLEQKRREAIAQHVANKNEMNALGEGILSPIRERLEQLSRRTRFHRSLMAPVARLPVEILANIFEAYVELKETPWKLALVSSRWRTIALSAPSLWKYILVTNDECLDSCEIWDVGGDIGKVLSSGHYTVCMNNAQLVSVLSLSKHVPLRIVLKLRSQCFPPWEDPDHTPLILLFGEPTSARMAEIEIILHGNGENFTLPLACYIEGPYPRLRRLTYAKWGYSWDTSFMSKLISSCKLTDLEFADSMPEGATTWSTWDSVRNLRIGYISHPDEFNAICLKLHNLHTLQGYIEDWPTEATPPTTFQFVKELELSCVPLDLYRLTLPALTKLSLSIPRSWEESNADVPPSWMLPALLELQIDLCNMEQAYLIPSASAPILNTLTITASEQCLSLSPITYPTVRSVQLDGHISSQLLEDLFSTAPNARKVTIVPAECELPLVMEALKSLAVAKKSRRVLFPDATEFYLGAEDWPVYDERDNVSSLAKLVVTNRRAGNIAPSVFEVYHPVHNNSFKTKRISYVDRI